MEVRRAHLDGLRAQKHPSAGAGRRCAHEQTERARVWQPVLAMRTLAPCLGICSNLCVCGVCGAVSAICACAAVVDCWCRCLQRRSREGVNANSLCTEQRLQSPLEVVAHRAQSGRPFSQVRAHKFTSLGNIRNGDFFILIMRELNYIGILQF